MALPGICTDFTGISGGNSWKPRWNSSSRSGAALCNEQKKSMAENGKDCDMKILAMGKCVPQQVLDNEALSHMVDTNDEWIISRTGIRQRRIAQGETVVSMAAAAARQAMERAGTSPEEIGLVLVCTFTPDLATPSAACLVQQELGLSTGVLAYDLNAACSGFIYGLVTAEALLDGMEPGKKALIIGAETHLPVGGLHRPRHLHPVR